MRSSRDFAAVIKSGKRKSSPTVVIYALSYPTSARADLSKVGFVVSKRVGNSVVRHAVVRRLRAIMASELPLAQPARVVVRARSRAAQASFTELKADVLAACRRLDLLRGASASGAGGDASFGGRSDAGGTGSAVNAGVAVNAGDTGSTSNASNTDNTGDSDRAGMSGSASANANAGADADMDAVGMDAITQRAAGAAAIVRGD